MEIIKLPIYYTFAKFIENYDLNFQKFKENFPDGDEDDYINAYRMNYSKFTIYDEYGNPTDELSTDTVVSRRENREDLFAGNVEKVSIFLICQILQERIDLTMENGDEIKNFEDLKDKILDKNPITTSFNDGYQITLLIIADFIEFFYFENGIISIDERRLQNFEFAIMRINDFFNTKIISSQLQQNEVIQNNKIIFNASRQIFGNVFYQLMENGFIEYVRFGDGKINKSATAEMFLKSFHFKGKNQPSVDYLTSAIFDNSLSNNKSEYITIRPLNNYE